jgi:hypothetical protein
MVIFKRGPRSLEGLMANAEDKHTQAGRVWDVLAWREPFEQLGIAGVQSITNMHVAASSSTTPASLLWPLTVYQRIFSRCFRPSSGFLR